MLQTIGNRDHRTGRTEPGKVGKSGILFLRSIWVGVEHFLQKILSYAEAFKLKNLSLNAYVEAQRLKAQINRIISLKQIVVKRCPIERTNGFKVISKRIVLDV